MAFSFSHRRGVEGQVRRIAGDQLTSAIEEADKGEDDFDKTVHRLRRRCKKLRGLLRLVRPVFRDFSQENGVFRDAAGSLSRTRDAAVMIATFEALVAEAEPAGAVVEKVRQVLKGRMGAMPDDAEKREMLAAFRDVMGAALARTHEWRIKGKGFEVLEHGLEDTYRRMRKGLDGALDEHSTEAFHDWRKDTKYHWHHVNLLQSTAPDLLAGRKALLDQLGELLGDHHNLAVLGEETARMAGTERLGDMIRERQTRLAEQAFTLGRQLTAERPGTLRARFEDYWRLLPAED